MVLVSMYLCLWPFRNCTIQFSRALLSHSRSQNLPIDDNTSRAAGIIVVDDQDDRLVEHTAKTLVGNQNTAGLNMRDLQ